MKKYPFSLKIEGEKVSPETTPWKDLKEIVDNLEESVNAIASNYKGEKFFSLVGLKPGSNSLNFALSRTSARCMSKITESIAENKYHLLPIKSHQNLIQLSKKAVVNNWKINFLENKLLNIPPAVITPETLVPDIWEQRTSGTTTIICECLRVGGAEPRAQVRLSTGEIKYFELSRELAKKIAERLYEMICLEGEAVWVGDEWHLGDFKPKKLLPFQDIDPVAAFEKLRHAANGNFDNIDVNEYVNSIRSEEL